MKVYLLLTVLLFSKNVHSQNEKFSIDQIQTKLDSIKAEGNLLYSFENAAWNSTDLASQNSYLKKNFGTYLTYKTNDTIKTVILDLDHKEVIVEYNFINSEKKPCKEIFIPRDLNQTEQELYALRFNLYQQLDDEKYEVRIPDGYNLNFITIPFNDKYKTYVITGASEWGVIPFGNDYLFITDNKGQILESKKFHVSFIPQQTSLSEGKKIVRAMHSHLKTNPFISATDICTFKLYAPYSDIDEFAVYSPEFKASFIYNYKNDTLIQSE